MHKNTNKKRKTQNNVENEEKETNKLGVANDCEAKPKGKKSTNALSEIKLINKHSNKSAKNKKSLSKREINLQNGEEETEKKNDNNSLKKYKYNGKNANNTNDDHMYNKKSYKSDKSDKSSNSDIKNENQIDNKEMKIRDVEINHYENTINDHETVLNEHKINSEKKKHKHYLINTSQDKSLLLNQLSLLETNKLYVKNINENIKKEDLENFFSKVTGYVDARIIYDSKGKLRNFAYIEFDNNENATNFLNKLETSHNEHFKKFILKNVNLYTCISIPQKSIYEEDKIFIKFIKCYNNNNLDIKDKITSFFSSHSISINDIRLLGDSSDKRGYVELKNREDVIKCVESIKVCKLEDLEFNISYSIPMIKKKTPLDLDKLKSNKEKAKVLKEEKKREENISTIIVKNLHFNTRKHKLVTFFEQIGEIENIYLSKKISDNNIKRNKGFAYITFKNPNDATSSLILNDSILDGRNILISKFLDDKNKKYSESKMGSYFNKNAYKNEKKNKKNYGNGNRFFEKKRISLNKVTENIESEKIEKRSDISTGSMTNEDFRKLFLK